MASDHRRSTNDGRSMFTPKLPHFFKIILEDTILDGKLEIPNKFVRKYGNGMLGPVVLEVPSGDVWKMGLTRSEGHVWLQYGWREFAGHYSLSYGHFLVFRYEGNCNFHVLIFDTSASETEYPNVGSRQGGDYCNLDKEFQEPAMGEAEDNISVEILHEIPPRRTVRQKWPLPCSRPCKRMKTSSDGIRFNPFLDKRGGKQVELEKSLGANNMSDSLINHQTEFVSQYEDYGAKEPTVPNNEENESDSSVQILDDDFSLFQRTQEASSLWHPRPGNKIRNRNSNRNRKGTSKIPPLTQHCRKEGIRATGMKIEKSTKNERLDDYMKESGGSLYFPATSGNTLGRSTERGRKVKTSSLTQSLSHKEEALRDRIFKSKNPVFRVKMCSTYISGGSLLLPFQFAKRYLGQKCDNIILCLPDRGTWGVKYAFTTKSTAKPKPRFYYSWKEFVLDNHLKVGDVCVFELIKGTQASFNVTILAAAKANATGANQVKSRKFLVPEIKSDRTSADLSGNSNLDDQSVGQYFQPTRRKCQVGANRVEQSGVEKSIEGEVTLQSPCLWRSHTVDTTRKFYTVVLRSHNFKYPSVTLQFQFVQKFVSQKREDWVLQVVDRTWHVKLISYPHYSYSKLSAGWRPFATDNSLKAGDICIFEIAEESISSMKVYFVRHSGRLEQSGVEKSAWASSRRKSSHTVDPTRIKVVLRLYHLKHNCVPISFNLIEKFISKTEEYWVLQVVDRTWPVKLISYPDCNRATLSAGWRSFATDNSLKAGDTCVFEITEESSATTTMKVSFVRRSG